MSSFYDLRFIAGIVAIVAFAPLFYEILVKKEKHSMASWFLWGIIDGVNGVLLFVQKGNWTLPAIYCIGCFITCIFIWKQKNWSWSRKETIITIFVVLCLIVWAIFGAVVATVVSTIVTVAAGIPLLIDTIRLPRPSPTYIWCIYMIANYTSTVAGKDWSIEERLYPASSFAYTVLMVLAAHSKHWRPQQRKGYL